jgi:hypothetical protein
MPFTLKMVTAMHRNVGTASTRDAAKPQKPRLYNHLSPVVTIDTTCPNIKKLCILSTQCIYVFHTILTIHKDYFPEQH